MAALPMKPDGCRCEGEEHKNPYCFVTPPRVPSIAARMQAHQIAETGDAAVHALLDRLDALHEPIKKHVDDPTLSWEARYARLEAHHVEETTKLVAKLHKTNEEVNGLTVDLDEQTRIAQGWKTSFEKTAADMANYAKAMDDYRRAFENLLAVIDRDGGHAQAGKTLVENAARAEKTVFELLAAFDERDRLLAKETR